jgi:hypothetical protein
VVFALTAEHYPHTSNSVAADAFRLADSSSRSYRMTLSSSVTHRRYLEQSVSASRYLDHPLFIMGNFSLYDKTTSGQFLLTTKPYLY